MASAQETIRVVWVTNLQAPYREPLWSELSKLCDLEVVFFAFAHPERSWQYSPRSTYRSRVLRTVELPPRNPDQYLYGVVGSLWSFLRNADVIVLGSWESPAYWQILRWARRHNVPCVAFVEATVSSSRYRGRHPIAQVRRWFFKSVDAVLCAGAASSAAAEVWGVETKKIVETFNAVDVKGIAARAIAIRKNGGLDNSDGHQFIFLGRLIAKKNLALVVCAFGVVARGRDSLTIVGDGPEAPMVAKLISELPADIACRVSMRASVTPDKVVELLASAHTLVLASTIETWGMVVCEALAAGAHVVVTDTVGCAPFVRNMPGSFVTANTKEGLIHGMLQSRLSWSGAIEQPEILSFDAARAASDALSAVRLAKATSRLQRRRPRWQ